MKIFTHEKEILRQIGVRRRTLFHDRIIAIYAFRSRIRQDNDELSDFDVLVVVRNRDPQIEDRIMEVFVLHDNMGRVSRPMSSPLLCYHSAKPFRLQDCLAWSNRKTAV